MQLWTQILEYRTLYGKFFTVLGDVLRTTAVIIASKETPRLPASVAARLMANIGAQSMLQSFASWFAEKRLQLTLILRAVCGVPGIGIRMDAGYVLFYPTGSESIFPAVFAKHLGSGASGVVFLSTDSRNVVKVFKDKRTAHHEADLLTMCHDDPWLRAPKFHGLYSDGHNLAVVMSYVGTPLRDIFSAPDAQKREIVDILKSLHRSGIHHHDVRAENLMIGHDGITKSGRSCRW
ncbi:hypothetical protein B0H16DRAFT_154417 [Mycena metata]|uniref:Protein kinase domain-containing protein n=1 Tax=Mycena metata TaxID=1033252 RepID=A0AAD7MVA7_9AGAR|nr:hypothetical protein B0H16DRAFT_154417 [Mycena metata]